MVSASRDERTVTPDQRAALEASLQRAFDASTNPDVRFHLRQALQLLAD
jgi:hypothetical protein